MTNRLARRRLRPLQVVLASTTVALFVGLNALLSWSYVGLNETTEAFGAAVEANATLSSVQRETLVLLDAIDRAGDADGFEHASVTLRFLQRHQHTFEVAADHSNEHAYTELSDEIRKNFSVVEAAFASAGSGPMNAAKRESAAAALRASEPPMKRLYDRSELRLFDRMGSALSARQTAERGMLGLSFMLLALAGVLVLSLRRGVRSDFDLAYDALTREAEEREAAEAKLRASEHRFRALVHHASDVFTVIDREGRIAYQSPAIERALGHQPDRLIGQAFFQLVEEGDHHLAVAALAQAGDPQSGTVNTELRLRAWSGDVSTFEVAVSRLPAADGDNYGSLVLNYRDISERLRYQEQLARQAFEDSLTGLANRALFANRLERALSRPSETAVAVLFLDLDRFKVVNDSLGHEAGDELLRQVADRLRACVRDSDTVARARSWVTSAEDTLARLGGDEFTIMLSDVEDADLPQRAAARIVAALQPSFEIGDNEVFISASVGVATGHPGQTTPDGLMRDADTAMYHAKWNGKNRYEMFDPVMQQRALERLRLEVDLRTAMDGGELTLAYQPIMELATGKAIAVEALLRWHHPELGDITPTKFVPIAEETGLIMPLGRWVIGEACRQTAGWRAMGLTDLTVNVNLSVRQLDDPDLVGHIQRTLDATGLPPAALCLEITETMLMENVAQVITILHQLKAVGLRLAIDDFGTGHSSLRYLKDFPIDVVKVDRGFVAELGNSASSTAIFEALIMLGTALGIIITAEGIETDHQLRTLARLRCPAGQGFLLAEPMAADEIPRRLHIGSLVHGRADSLAQHR
jgi:diguanylate cyclase (GGDEF)-like protein/PAS domain S-box-containing protein